MPQSLSAVYIHLVFSTKERRPLLRDESLRTALHAYLGRVSRELDCPPLRVGGVEDHVHLLGRLGREQSQANWVKELKRISNAWLREQGDEHHQFQWQRGYATFSVSHSRVDRVMAYVANQAEHHRKQTYCDKLRTLLRRHVMTWDERYVWD